VCLDMENQDLTHYDSTCDGFEEDIRGGYSGIAFRWGTLFCLMKSHESS
jgi:hypothetical protein